MPLYKVGVDTRQRKYELDMKDINHSRPDWELVNKGNEAAHSGRALADAMLFHQLCTETRSLDIQENSKISTIKFLPR